MKTKLLSSIGVLACIAAGVGAANAADMAPVYKAPVYKAPVILSDWAGLYVGVNGGYGWSNGDYLPPPPPGILAVDPPVKQKGGVFGGQVGYNWQFGSIVAGVEGDFDGADITGTVDGVTAKTNELATVRGRLGYTVLPDWLVYGTAGAGWANTEVTGISDVSRTGWVAGGGVEYKFYSHWLLRGEYLHYGFDDVTVVPVPGASLTLKSLDVVRGGLSYKF